MAALDDLDDDYVARLLAEDAKKTSQKYSSQGLSAFLPKRRALDAPKPNTRFLSHIVREADSHNAALKRKEEIEARKRLRELHGQDERPRKRYRADETADSKRSRFLKDIVSAANSENKTKHRDRGSSRRSESKWKFDIDGREGSSRPRQGERERDFESSRTKTRRRSASPDKTPHRQSETSYNSSRRNKREKPNDRENRSEDAIVKNSLSGSSNDHNERLRRDSEELVRKRGRGALKTTSGIDDRFRKDYDPSQDVSLESDHEDNDQDWDMALEAMRDRAKLKRNQVARMREAGFDEEDIQKWQKGSHTQPDHGSNLRDVKWSRRGEVREWDAGKEEQ